MTEDTRKSVWDLLEEHDASVDETAALYSWSLNYDAGKGPFPVYLDLIGWSEDHFGEALSTYGPRVTVRLRRARVPLEGATGVHHRPPRRHQVRERAHGRGDGGRVTTAETARRAREYTDRIGRGRRSSDLGRSDVTRYNPGRRLSDQGPSFRALRSCVSSGIGPWNRTSGAALDVRSPSPDLEPSGCVPGAPSFFQKTPGERSNHDPGCQHAGQNRREKPTNGLGDLTETGLAFSLPPRYPELRCRRR
jgi:hypothetical protein